LATYPLTLHGIVKFNAGAYSGRIDKFKAKYIAATGISNLHPGSINVWVDEYIAIWPQFEIKGSELDDSKQDHLFESCKITVDGTVYPAYRVRPHHRPTGGGGNGDKCLELVAEYIPGIEHGKVVTVKFDRESRP